MWRHHHCCLPERQPPLSLQLTRLTSSFLWTEKLCCLLQQPPVLQVHVTSEIPMSSDIERRGQWMANEGANSKHWSKSYNGPSRQLCLVRKQQADSEGSQDIRTLGFSESRSARLTPPKATKVDSSCSSKSSHTPVHTNVAGLSSLKPQPCVAGPET